MFGYVLIILTSYEIESFFVISVHARRIKTIPKRQKLTVKVGILGRYNVVYICVYKKLKTSCFLIQKVIWKNALIKWFY